MNNASNWIYITSSRKGKMWWHRDDIPLHFGKVWYLRDMVHQGSLKPHKHILYFHHASTWTLCVCFICCLRELGLCVCRREQVVKLGEYEQLINDKFLWPFAGTQSNLTSFVLSFCPFTCTWRDKTNAQFHLSSLMICDLSKHTHLDDVSSYICGY